MKQKAYARAGVDIDLGNKVKSALPRMLKATHRPEVLGKVGAGCPQIPAARPCIKR